MLDCSKKIERMDPTQMKDGLYLVLYDVRSLLSTEDSYYSFYLLLDENDNWKPEHRSRLVTHPQTVSIINQAKLHNCHGFSADPCSHADTAAGTTNCMNFLTMQFLGGKLSAAQLQVAGWVGSVRRSLQGALELVWGNTEENQDEEDKDKDEEESGDGEGRFQRAMSPLRSFARRSRRSLHRFSIRSRQTLQRRTTETCSVRAGLVSE